METRGRIAFWAATACLLCVLVVGSGAPLLDPDEARFARTTVEMIRAADPVIPQFEGQPRLAKPPLLHWIQSGFVEAFGPSPRVFRLHALLATLGSFLLVGWVARRRFGDEGAAWAAAVFATMPLVVAVGKIGTVDALLSVHVIAVIALDLADPDRSGPVRAAVAGAITGLAFLAKGPVGVVVPVLAVLAARTAARRELLPDARRAVAASAGFAAVVLPWGLALLGRLGIDGVESLLHREVYDRYVEGTAHVEPFWYYLPVLAVAWLPWAGPLVVGAIRAARRRRAPEARTAVQAAAALAAGVIFFSLGKGKLPTYVLPLSPLAAWVVAWEIGQEIRAPGRRKPGSWLVAGTLLALAAGLGAASARPDLAHEFALTARTGAAATGLAGLVAAWGAGTARPRLAYGAGAAGSAAFLLLASALALPQVGRASSTEGLVRTVPELASDRPIAAVWLRVPSLTFYLDRVPEYVEAEDVEERLDRDDGVLLVFDARRLERLPGHVRARLHEVGRFGKYRVLEAAPAAGRPAEQD